MACALEQRKHTVLFVSRSTVPNFSAISILYRSFEELLRVQPLIKLQGRYKENQFSPCGSVKQEERTLTLEELWSLRLPFYLSPDLWIHSKIVCSAVQ